MNIIQLYEHIKQYALTIPIVNSYYNTSVYECWNNPNVKYGSVVFAVKSVREQNSISKYECVIYYGDRLNDNKSNRDAIQSDAVGVINNIINRLNSSNLIEYVTYPVQSVIFEQKFSDELAGAYANITIDLQATGDDCDFNLLDDYYTKEQIDERLDDIAAGDLDLSNYYTKAQVDKKLSDIEEGDIDLTNYYTKTQIDNKGFLTSIPSDYATKQWVDSEGFLTSIPSEYVTESKLAAKKYLTAVPGEYVTESELNAALKNVDLTGYATEEWVDSQGYLNTSEVDKKIQDAVLKEVNLSNYYTKQQIDNKGYITSIPSEYVTENQLESKGYITTIPSQYATKQWVQNEGYLTSIPTEYVTESELEAKKYLTAVPSEYVTENELSAKGYVTTTALNNRGYATLTQVDSKIQDAVTSGIDLTGYATENWVNNQGFITAIPSEYVTEKELTDKGYLTSVPAQYATKQWVQNEGYLTSIPSQYITESELETRLDDLNLNVDLSNYYTKGQIDSKGYVTGAELVTKDYATKDFVTSEVNKFDLSDYYNKEQVDNKFQPKGNYLTSIPSEYVTESELSAKGYITSIPSQYITESELSAKGYLTSVPSQYVTETELTSKGYATTTQVGNKQDKLVSGNNIKTINGVSILGSGNIEIQGGTGGNVDLSDYFTKSETYNVFYTKEQVDAMVGAVNQILDSLINDVDTEAIEVSLNNILNEK
jgi:hypothetical protein